MERKEIILEEQSRKFKKTFLGKKYLWKNAL